MVPSPGNTGHRLHQDHHENNGSQEKGDPLPARRPNNPLNRKRVDGTATITEEANGISTNISALVSNSIQDEMLLSYAYLIALKIIPGVFPNTVIESC